MAISLSQGDRLVASGIVFGLVQFCERFCWRNNDSGECAAARLLFPNQECRPDQAKRSFGSYPMSIRRGCRSGVAPLLDPAYFTGQTIAKLLNSSHH